MTDLERLIAAVEAGSIARHDLDAFIPWRGLDNLTNDCLDAYNGSLDAALRLHEALLPGWEAEPCTSGGVSVWLPLPMVDEIPAGSISIYDPIEERVARLPARAWLLAILRALKAKGDA